MTEKKTIESIEEKMSALLAENRECVRREIESAKRVSRASEECLRLMVEARKEMDHLRSRLRELE